MISFTSDKGLDLIKAFESFSPVVYICPAGFLTIGYGHVLRSGEHYEGISKSKAEELLQLDLNLAEKAVMRNISIAISQSQFDALVSFTFNLGGGALQRSSLRQKINYGACKGEIHDEFMRWVYAGGRKITGLVRRRAAEAGMYAA